MPFRMIEYDVLARLADIVELDCILDLGCGRGRQSYVLAMTGAKVIGLDPSSECIESARRMQGELPNLKALEFQCATLEAARFASDSFSKIISFSVIEHIPEYEAVLRECFRVLKPGGQFLITTDSLLSIESAADRDMHRVACHVVRYFEKDELRDLLERVGFRDVNVQHLFRSPYAAREFSRALHNKFIYGRVESFIKYLRLRFCDAMTDKMRPGIFLVACARKS